MARSHQADPTRPEGSSPTLTHLLHPNCLEGPVLRSLRRQSAGARPRLRPHVTAVGQRQAPTCRQARQCAGARYEPVVKGGCRRRDGNERCLPLSSDSRPGAVLGACMITSPLGSSQCHDPHLGYKERSPRRASTHILPSGSPIWLGQRSAPHPSGHTSAGSSLLGVSPWVTTGVVGDGSRTQKPRAGSPQPEAPRLHTQGSAPGYGLHVNGWRRPQPRSSQDRREGPPSRPGRQPPLPLTYAVLGFVLFFFTSSQI